ncbi:MAG: NifU family protein [Actinomycetota bacterium]|nr:NifU family protein [Actinomycetota bacterium]
MLPEPIQAALIEIARKFDSERISYRIGGSAMLAMSGIDVPIGDIDLVVDATSREAVDRVLADRDVEEPDSSGPWRSDWFVRTSWPTDSGTVNIDVIGGLALVIDERVAIFPFGSGQRVDLGGVEISVGSLAHWYHLYRVHDPGKAALIAGRLSDKAIMGAATELGIGDVFSPTLIVRIGNSARADWIERDMSDQVQNSIIEVASPSEQAFDEPGSEIIDLALLDETLEYIRPALQADGGDLVLLGTTGGKVTLQMVGACGGCPLSTMTLTAGIERILQDRVPGVTEVVAL